jgi:predicted aspartyl protease
MKYKVLGMVLLNGCLASAAWAQQNASLQSWEIPFSLYKSFMIVVQGSIGDMGPLNFLIDTGTNPSVVDKRITKKLRISGYKTSLPVVSGEVATSEVLVPSVSVGPVTQPAVRMAVEDLAMLEHELGVRIDAMVGLDVLGARTFRIDYETGSILFGPAASSSGESTSFQSEPPFVTVEMKMNQQPLHLLVDTGSAELVLFESHLASRLRGLAGVLRTSRNLKGEFALREVQLSDVQLGNSSFGARRAYVTTDRNRSLSFDGLLGVSALHVRQVSFDFEHRRFTWQSQNTWIPTMAGEVPDNCTVAESRAAMSQSLLRSQPNCMGTHPRRMSAQ